MLRVLSAAAIMVLVLAPVGARAQFNFNWIFGPPRPPANVPNGDRSAADPRQPGNPDAGQAGASVGSGVQSRPLPPVPGAAVDPSPAGQPNQQTLSALPGEQRQPRAARPDAAPPSDETVVEPPTQRIGNQSALFSGLDKITGRVINFDVAIGETVQFGALQVTPRACYTRPPTETANTDAFVEVDEVTLQGEVKRIFTGWMFAASPGLHAVEHPIYDVWLTDCKNPAQTVAAAPDPAPPPAAARAPPAPKQPAPKRSAAPAPQTR